jgi:uncharacterized membrane protein YesL
MNPFVTFWRAGRDLFDELFLMIGLNLLWVLICGPLPAAAVFFLLNGAPVPAGILALASALLIGPASAGLLAVSHRIVEGRVASVSDFVAGMRTYRVLSWKVYGVWITVLIVLLVNLYFYAQMTTPLGVFLTMLFLYLALAWCALLLYLGPLLILQEQRRLRLMLRNALVMSFGRPVFTLVLAILVVIVTLLSIWVVILPLLLTFSFFALLGMRATVTLIAADEQRRLEREQQSVPEDEPITEKGRSGQVRPRK